ncbi:SET domain containing protein [Aphelenchoides avenae]|nr:SET domain containing protein [Aphelenchus avenae]
MPLHKELKPRSIVEYYAVNREDRIVEIIGENRYDATKYQLLSPAKDDELLLLGIVVKEEDERDAIYCSNCQAFYKHGCRLHPLYFIPNKLSQPDLYGEMAAKETCPKILRIDVSHIPRAGLGVFANVKIPEGFVFGPYEGVRDADPLRAESGYSFVVDPDTGPRYYVDAADPRTSNFLRYVNCSRSCEEENCVPIQYYNEVYFRISRAIDADEELLLFYGYDYARNLGIEYALEEA